MKLQIGRLLSAKRKLLLATAGVAALAVPIAVGALMAPRLHAQAGQSPARQAPATQFQTAQPPPNQSIAIQSPTSQSPAALAQVGAAERPAFDVASVKTNKGGDNRVMIGVLQAGGRYTSTNVTLEMLITAAYQLKPHQMAGAPDWLASERF